MTATPGMSNGSLRTIIWILGIIATVAPVAVAWGMLIYSDKMQGEEINQKLDKEYFMLYKENIDAKLNKIEVKIDDIHEALLGESK